MERIIYLFCDIAYAKYCNLPVLTIPEFQVSVRILACLNDGMGWFCGVPPPHYQYLRVRLAVRNCAVESNPVVYQQIVKSLS